MFKILHSFIHGTQINKTQLDSRYGGKKGFIKYWFYKNIFLFQHQTFDGDWRKIKRLIFICSGNICRSPYAEHYAKKNGFKSLSFGLNVAEKEPANPAAIATAKKKNIDLSTHMSTNISEYIYEKDDLVFIFEPYHASHIKQLKINLKAPVLLLGQYHSQKIPYIHDPYMTRGQYFDQCFSIIEESIDNVKNLIQGQA